MSIKYISNHKSLLCLKQYKSFHLYVRQNGHSTTTSLWEAITSLWRYAQCWNFRQIKASMTQDDQTDTLLYLLSERVTNPRFSSGFLPAFQIKFHNCLHYEEDWTQDTPLHTKLWGNADDLRRTASFTAASGLKIWLNTANQIECWRRARRNFTTVFCLIFVHFLEVFRSLHREPPGATRRGCPPTPTGDTNFLVVLSLCWIAMGSKFSPHLPSPLVRSSSFKNTCMI